MRQLQLIHLYYYVCQCYDTYLCLHFQRQSNNSTPRFSDQEVITIYLFGLLNRRFTAKDTYELITDYWLSWFPHLPSYQGYNHRINALHWHLEVMVGHLTSRLSFQDCYQDVCLTDSLPIILSRRPYQAKAALALADKGFCSTKDLYYHGVKFHFLGLDRYGKMPLPEQMQFSPASFNDLTVLKTVLPSLNNRWVIGDKIFACTPLNEQLAAQQVEILTPIKLKKGQKRLDAADQYLSTYISSIRQPVESFFNWLIEKTQIQTASKVRSENALSLHCYGRIAAALICLVFNS
jgi:hypothetical protein